MEVSLMSPVLGVKGQMGVKGIAQVLKLFDSLEMNPGKGQFSV